MKNTPEIAALSMLLMVMVMPLPAHAERMQPWAVDATDSKAGYEPVFKHYRMMEAVAPAAEAKQPEHSTGHAGHKGHEGHEMTMHPATPESVETRPAPGSPAQSKPAEAKRDTVGAPANDGAQHQHHH